VGGQNDERGGRVGWWDGGAPLKLFRVGRRKWRDEADKLSGQIPIVLRTDGMISRSARAHGGLQRK
jgi:hypothetical protein